MTRGGVLEEGGSSWGGVLEEGSGSWVVAIAPYGGASQHKEAHERRGDPAPIIIRPFIRAPLEVAAICHGPVLGAGDEGCLCRMGKKKGPGARHRVLYSVRRIALDRAFARTRI